MQELLLSIIASLSSSYCSSYCPSSVININATRQQHLWRTIEAPRSLALFLCLSLLFSLFESFLSHPRDPRQSDGRRESRQWRCVSRNAGSAIIRDATRRDVRVTYAKSKTSKDDDDDYDGARGEVGKEEEQSRGRSKRVVGGCGWSAERTGVPRVQPWHGPGNQWDLQHRRKLGQPSPRP